MDAQTLEKLRRRLANKQIMLVSNRRNRGLEQQLSVMLQLQIQIRWVDSKRPRRLSAAKEGICAGGCDLVLIATSFIGHNVEDVLKQPCKRSDVRVVDVKKGRLHACLRALAAAFPD